MRKNKAIIGVLCLLLLTGCGKGGIQTETMTPEERAESARLAEESRAAAESLALESEQESRRLEAEEKRRLAEEAKALKEKQLAEDKAMAIADFAENRYTTFDGVDYELTFMDSFNGHYLDMTKWAYTPEWERDDCIWSSGAVSLEDGALLLSVTGEGVPYEAGAIRTKELFEQAYGYWEVRAKLGAAEGINAAFWLMCEGAGHADVMGAADGAEIDIIEGPHHDWQQVQHAVHMDGYAEKHKSQAHPMDIEGIYSQDQWHTFSLVWTPEKYDFYIDGEKTWTVRGNWVCQVPCYAKLTAAVGGWAGTLDPTVTPVAGMTVDYIKVYLPVEGYDTAS